MFKLLLSSEVVKWLLMSLYLHFIKNNFIAGFFVCFIIKNSKLLLVSSSICLAKLSRGEPWVLLALYSRRMRWRLDLCLCVLDSRCTASAWTETLFAFSWASSPRCDTRREPTATCGHTYLFYNTCPIILEYVSIIIWNIFRRNLNCTVMFRTKNLSSPGSGFSRGDRAMHSHGPCEINQGTWNGNKQLMNPKTEKLKKFNLRLCGRSTCPAEASPGGARKRDVGVLIRAVCVGHSGKSGKSRCHRVG